MDPLQEHELLMTRRQLLMRGRGCLGAAALATLIGAEQATAATAAGTATGAASGDRAYPGLPSLPHFPPTAKRVIYLFMAGGPSHIDMFDYKPALRDIHGTELPDSIRQGQRITGMTSGQKSFPCVAPMFEFKQFGERGTWVNTEVLPHTASIVDELTIIRSMNTEAINHDPAITYINTGTQQLGRPSMGAWLSYGLGSPNDELPAYVTMISVGAKPGQALFSRLWGSGFLPSKHQGVQFRSGGDPVLYLTNPQGVDADVRRKMLDGIAKLNAAAIPGGRRSRDSDADRPVRDGLSHADFRARFDGRQLRVPGDVLTCMGPMPRNRAPSRRIVMLARRMAERGVPFVQLFHRGWDQHGNLPKELKRNCDSVDQPAVALVKDLKQRGMLDDTIVIFGGEFGRTIYSQGKLTKDNHGATITDAASRLGSPVADSNAVSTTARQTTTATTSSRIPCTSTISTPPSCTPWESITSASPSSIKDSTRN